MEIITRDPSMYTVERPKFIASNQKEEFISTQLSKVYGQVSGY